MVLARHALDVYFSFLGKMVALLAVKMQCSSTAGQLQAKRSQRVFSDFPAAPLVASMFQTVVIMTAPDHGCRIGRTQGFTMPIEVA